MEWEHSFCIFTPCGGALLVRHSETREYHGDAHDGTSYSGEMRSCWLRACACGRGGARQLLRDSQADARRADLVAMALGEAESPPLLLLLSTEEPPGRPLRQLARCLAAAPSTAAQCLVSAAAPDSSLMKSWQPSEDYADRWNALLEEEDEDEDEEDEEDGEDEDEEEEEEEGEVEEEGLGAYELRRRPRVDYVEAERKLREELAAQQEEQEQEQDEEEEEEEEEESAPRPTRSRKLAAPARTSPRAKRRRARR
jgi:hypothetical protein